MNEPLVFKYHDVPRFTYLLRRWFDDPADNTSTQAQVVVISEIEPLTRKALLAKLQDLDAGEASEFLLVDMAPCASAVLDTWERGIDGTMRDEFAAPCRLYRNWWDLHACVEVVEEAA